MNDDVTPIAVNLPFPKGRLPVCGCDMGDKPMPSRLQRMECRMRGGPCRPSDAPDIPDTPAP